MVSGSPQSAVVNAAFANTLKVLVKDASNNPVAGATVTFAAPGSGASGAFAGGQNTAVTDITGVATSAPIIANGAAGSYAVTASLGALSTSFALTNTANNSAGSTQLPEPVSVSPASGNTLSQTFTYTFSNPTGAENLGVLNILVNSALDGRNACYLAYVPAGLNSGTLLLVNDAGAAGGPFQQLSIPGSGTISNSQCTINGTGSSVSGSGNTMTLTLATTFAASFPGNKVIYMAGRDNASHNSGWQALGVWKVPGPAPTGPAVGGVSPGASRYRDPDLYIYFHRHQWLRRSRRSQRPGQYSDRRAERLLRRLRSVRSHNRHGLTGERRRRGGRSFPIDGDPRHGTWFRTVSARSAERGVPRREAETR